MITDKKELAEAVCRDTETNLGKKKITSQAKFRASYPVRVCGYLKLLRRLEFAIWRRDHAKNAFAAKLAAQKVKMIDRRRNLLGTKLGLEIPPCRVEKGVRIAHPGVILNGYVGEGCIFHGNNVLGNKRTGAGEEIPRLGKNVDVGVGAIVIGGVEIAEGCIIGAGAVVTRSFTTPGTVIAGVPAKEIKA